MALKKSIVVTIAIFDKTLKLNFEIAIVIAIDSLYLQNDFNYRRNWFSRRAFVTAFN